MAMRRLGRVCLISAVLLAATAASARGECGRIHYGAGQNYISARGTRGLATLSVPPDELTVNNLLCLAQGLHANYPEWRAVVVLFFASQEAAKRWRPEWVLGDYVGPMPPTWKWETDMRAGYFLDAAKGEEYLLLTPFGWNSGNDELATRIDLPLAGTPGCTVGLGSRCLLAWERFSYPSDPIAGVASGSVIVEGRVGRDGSVTSVRATDGGAFPETATKALADAAVKHVRSWRFEPSPRDDRFRITYWYTPDSSIAPGMTRINVEFPERVRVSGNPVVR
jgi:TonB family protein